MIGKVFNPIVIIIAFVILSNTVASSPREYQVKAAFLYNFVKFVEWPGEALPDTSATITLCMLGEHPFGINFEQTIRGKIVKGRELVIERFKEILGLEGCHILFVSSSEKSRLPQILEAIKDMSLLTVGETERFAKLGGIINFFIEENKVRFEINTDAAKRARLQVSSNLLKLAKVIRTESGHESN